MKRKSLIIGILVAMFSLWLVPDAAAQRRNYHPQHRSYHGHGYYHRGYHARPRVYRAPRVVVVPQYGYRRGHYRPRGYYRRHYYNAPPPRYYHGHRYYHRGRGWR